ncbi:MAG: hypothetical protein Q4D76_14680 [Oscillospiraceae bacterium]|nr:hypothetical protein [Oscillospiraceae bacterium]
MKMRINWVYNGLVDITLDINLDDTVAILLDDSGTGKTFMFKVLSSYCVINQIRCEKFDYSDEHRNLEYFRNTIGDAEIVLMDNADLYMTQELLDYLKNSGKQVIISIKHIEKFTSCEGCGFYTVDYDGKSLKTVRENYGFAI